MKKLLILISVMFLVLSIGSIVHAASIDGAQTQGKGKLAIGLDEEFVFNRDMEFKSIDPPIEPGTILEVKPKIDKMYRAMLKVNYGLLENLDIYLKLGTADFKDKQNWIHTQLSPFAWDRGTRVLKGENAFAYGFGAKGTYNLKGNWIIGCDIQYLKHKNDYKGTKNWDDSEGTLWQASLKGDATFQEWQVAPYIAKKIGNLVPYLGVKYSNLKERYYMVTGSDDEEVWKLKADDNVGVLVGTDYKISKNWKLNLEGRFVDETAMSFGATYRF